MAFYRLVRGRKLDQKWHRLGTNRCPNGVLIIYPAALRIMPQCWHHKLTFNDLIYASLSNIIPTMSLNCFFQILWVKSWSKVLSKSMLVNSRIRISTWCLWIYELLLNSARNSKEENMLRIQPSRLLLCGLSCLPRNLHTCTTHWFLPSRNESFRKAFHTPVIHYLLFAQIFILLHGYSPT